MARSDDGRNFAPGKCRHSNRGRGRGGGGWRRPNPCRRIRDRARSGGRNEWRHGLPGRRARQASGRCYPESLGQSTREPSTLSESWTRTPPSKHAGEPTTGRRGVISTLLNYGEMPKHNCSSRRCPDDRRRLSPREQSQARLSTGAGGLGLPSAKQRGGCWLPSGAALRFYRTFWRNVHAPR